MKMVAGKDRERHDGNDSLPQDWKDERGKRKSVFGKFADSDFLSQIKELALDPCKEGVLWGLIRPLWNQTLKVRNAFALSDAEFPRRKRKLQQFLKAKFAVVHGLASDIYSQQNVTKLSRGRLSHASSASCLLNPVDSPESSKSKITINTCESGSLLTGELKFLENRVPSDFSSLDNVSEWGPSNKDNSPMVDSDESVNGSNPLSPENMTHGDSPSLCLDDSVQSSNAWSSEEPRQKHLQTPRRSIRLLNFIGDNLHRTVIPIGPSFQADVPVWTGPANKAILGGDYAETENSRWLGTQTWPVIDGNTETTERMVGKGRDGSCSCESPGSETCTKHHVLGEKLVLRSDLGFAFYSWKFDEMGEEISKLWTLKEQVSFASLMKMYPLSNGKNFMKHALKCFPSKRKESIVSYYFNVCIPRRISMQTRLSTQEIDSDDDDAEDIICKSGSDKVGSVKHVKRRYLHPRS